MRSVYLLFLMVCTLSATTDAQTYWQNDFGPWGGAAPAL